MKNFMKNFNFLVLFAISMLESQQFLRSEIATQQSQSIMTYIYTSLVNKQEPIPAQIASTKKCIIFDLDGVLCTTNELQAFYEIGMDTIFQYMLKHGVPSKTNLFKALEHAPALTTFAAYDQGLRIPQIMVDWQCNAQDVRDIQDTMIKHILDSQITIEEKNLQVNTVLMMTNPKKLIATRQAIYEGIALVRTLKKLGYKVYALSNWDAASFPLFVEKFPEIFTYEDQNLFDGIMISGKTGMIKPNKNIFEACLSKFKLKKTEAIFIDDTIENIQAAQAIGITSIHCKNRNIANVTKELIIQLHSK